MHRKICRMNPSNQMGEVPFKVCPLCDAVWGSRDDFLRDPDLELIGYQVDFRELTAGLFLLNHSCNGTLAIEAHDFEDLYDGPIFKERSTGSEDCPRYCLHQDELEPCPAECECAYVREIVQVGRNWEKDPVS